MTEGEFFRDLKIDDRVKSLQRDGKEKSSPALAGDFLRSHQNYKLTMEETSAIFPVGKEDLFEGCIYHNAKLAD
jgi:hypothetical protein